MRGGLAGGLALSPEAAVLRPFASLKPELGALYFKFRFKSNSLLNLKLKVKKKIER